MATQRAQPERIRLNVVVHGIFVPVESDKSVNDLKDVIEKNYKKVFPNLQPITILRVQTARGFDINEDETVSDTFINDEDIRIVLCQPDAPNSPPQTQTESSSSEYSSEYSSEHDSEHDSEHSSEHDSEHDSEHSSEHSSEHDSEHSFEHTPVNSTLCKRARPFNFEAEESQKEPKRIRVMVGRDRPSDRSYIGLELERDAGWANEEGKEQEEEKRDATSNQGSKNKPKLDTSNFDWEPRCEGSKEERAST
jgi:hypothetical protein